MEINEPKCNITESRINIDNENDFNKLYESDMESEEVI